MGNLFFSTLEAEQRIQLCRELLESRVISLIVQGVVSIICHQYVPKFEYELAFGHVSISSSLCSHTVEGLGFDCINVSLDVWTPRNCFQSYPFLTGISEGILVQKEERFHQNPVVKADVAMCGKIRKYFTHPFLSPTFVLRCQMFVLISVAHLCILFLHAIIKSDALFCMSP